MLHWFRRRSRSSRRTPQHRGRPRLYLEPLETRALLSAASLVNPLVLLANPASTHALVAAPVSAANPATPTVAAAATQSAALLSRTPTLGTGPTTSINPIAQVTATATSGSTQTGQLVPELQVTPVLNFIQVGRLVFADLSFNVSLTFVPSPVTTGTATTTTQNTGTTTVQQPTLTQQLTIAPTLPTVPTTVPNTAPSATLGTAAPQSTTTALTATPPAASAPSSSTVVSSTATATDARFLLLFAQQPRMSAVIVPVVLNGAAADGESLLLASPLSPLPSNADRQNVPGAAALSFTARPTGLMLFGIDQGAPILQRVIGGVGGDVEAQPQAPQELEAPPVMPWNAAALPAATAPLGHTPAALTVLDAIDSVLADDARVAARTQEQVIENSQGVRTALAPAMALGGVALVLGGLWSPAADAYDREERKLPKGH